MATFLTDNLSRTYNGQETAELFITPALQGQNNFDQYRIIPNVATKRQMNFRAQADKITRKATGCSFTAKGNVSLTDKVLDVNPIEAQGQLCDRDLADTVFEDTWFKQGNDRPDATGTIAEQIMMDYIVEGVKRDNTRVVWFGDEDDGDADFNHIDGFWRLMLDSSGSLGATYNITNVETGGSLDTDAAETVFKNLFENIPAYAWQLGRSNFRFYVSHGLELNYRTTLRADATDTSNTIRINGLDTLAFEGIPVVTIPEWDDDLADSSLPASISNGFNTTSDNLAILTIADNLVIGTDLVSSARGTDARIWYSMDNKETRYDVNYKLGCQLLHEGIIAAAY